MRTKGTGIYNILVVLSAFCLGGGIGIYLESKSFVVEWWSYFLLVFSLLVNLVNISFFEKKYIEFINSTDPKFTFADDQETVNQ